MDVPPGRRRHLLNEGQHFCIAARLVFRDQPRKDRGVVIDDGVRDQPRTLVTDLDFDVGSPPKTRGSPLRKLLIS